MQWMQAHGAARSSEIKGTCCIFWFKPVYHEPIAGTSKLKDQEGFNQDLVWCASCGILLRSQLRVISTTHPWYSLNFCDISRFLATWNEGRLLNSSFCGGSQWRLWNTSALPTKAFWWIWVPSSKVSFYFPWVLLYYFIYLHVGMSPSFQSIERASLTSPALEILNAWHHTDPYRTCRMQVLQCIKSRARVSYRCLHCKRSRVLQNCQAVWSIWFWRWLRHRIMSFKMPWLCPDHLWKMKSWNQKSKSDWLESFKLSKYLFLPFHRNLGPNQVMEGLALAARICAKKKWRSWAVGRIYFRLTV